MYWLIRVHFARKHTISNRTDANFIRLPPVRLTRAKERAHTMVGFYDGPLFTKSQFGIIFVVKMLELFLHFVQDGLKMAFEMW